MITAKSYVIFVIKILFNELKFSNTDFPISKST